MNTILLLVMSNVFMTFAWYGHLKYGHDWPLWQAILVSWAIALLEYCLAVPANRIGYGEFSGFQLKIIQEIVTLVVFVGFAILFLHEKPAWNYLVAFGFLGIAAFLAFAFKASGPVRPDKPTDTRMDTLVEPKQYVRPFSEDLPEVGDWQSDRGETRQRKLPTGRRRER
jgi:uncharacterized protein (DUF486 family)